MKVIRKEKIYQNKTVFECTIQEKNILSTHKHPFITGLKQSF